MLTKETVPVTVVVISHNYGQYLPKCLSSISKQSIRPSEYFVYSDSSTDDTKEQSLLWGFPCYEVNLGSVAETRKEALARVKTPWVLFVDADNWLKEDFLEKAWAKAQASKDPNLSCIYPTVIVTGTDEDLWFAEEKQSWQVNLENFAENCSLLRVESIKRAGYWLKDPYEDWGLNIRLTGCGFSSFG